MEFNAWEYFKKCHEHYAVCEIVEAETLDDAFWKVAKAHGTTWHGLNGKVGQRSDDKTKVSWHIGVINFS